MRNSHIDRKLETLSVMLSKQLCAKPIAPTVWRFNDVADHWDRLVLRSHVVRDGSRLLYQEGLLSCMRPPGDLVERRFGRDTPLPRNTAMFCGTLAVDGAIAPAERFEIELEDPVLGCRIAHAYDVTTLPVEE